MSEKPRPKDIFVDPKTYEPLEAEWEKETVTWLHAASRLLASVRRQAAIVAIPSIVALTWIAGVRASDFWLLIAAMVAIAAIAVPAEMIDGKYDHSKRREGATKSRNASQDKTVDR